MFIFEEHIEVHGARFDIRGRVSRLLIDLDAAGLPRPDLVGGFGDLPVERRASAFDQPLNGAAGKPNILLGKKLIDSNGLGLKR